MRVLVTITPQMYRQAIALSIRRRRSGCEVRVAAPEDAEGELVAFRPHLLVHNDDDGLGPDALAHVLCRITVIYTDSMGARVSARGRVSEAPDMSTEELLRVVDATIAMAQG